MGGVASAPRMIASAMRAARTFARTSWTRTMSTPGGDAERRRRERRLEPLVGRQVEDLAERRLARRPEQDRPAEDAQRAEVAEQDARLCSAVFPKPIPGSTMIRSQSDAGAAAPARSPPRDRRRLAAPRRRPRPARAAAPAPPRSATSARSTRGTTRATARSRRSCPRGAGRRRGRGAAAGPRSAGSARARCARRGAAPPPVDAGGAVDVHDVGVGAEAELRSAVPAHRDDRRTRCRRRSGCTSASAPVSAAVGDRARARRRAPRP